MADTPLRNGLVRFIAGMAILEFIKFNLKTFLRYLMFEDRFRILELATVVGANAVGLWVMSRYLKTLRPLPQVQDESNAETEAGADADEGVADATPNANDTVATDDSPAVPALFPGFSIQYPEERTLRFDMDEVVGQAKAEVTLKLDNPSLMIAGKCRLNVLHHYRVTPAKFLLTSEMPVTITIHMTDVGRKEVMAALSESGGGRVTLNLVHKFMLQMLQLDHKVWQCAKGHFTSMLKRYWKVADRSMFRSVTFDTAATIEGRHNSPLGRALDTPIPSLESRSPLRKRTNYVSVPPTPDQRQTTPQHPVDRQSVVPPEAIVSGDEPSAAEEGVAAPSAEAVPAADDPSPASEQTAAPSAEAVPAADDPSPASQQTAPPLAAPSAEAVPAADDPSPASEQTAAPSAEAVPAADDSSPASERTDAPSAEAAPAADDPSPVSEQTVAQIDDEDADTDEDTPSSSQEDSSSGDEAPMPSRAVASQPPPAPAPAAPAPPVAVAATIPEPPEPKFPTAPGDMLRALRKTREVFNQHIKDDFFTTDLDDTSITRTNAAGNPWVLSKTKGFTDSSGQRSTVHVFASKMPNNNAMVFATTRTVTGSLVDIFRDWAWYPRRKSWDPNVNRYLIRSEFADGINITQELTHPIAGGIITPRVFMSLRQLVENPKAGICGVYSISWDKTKPENARRATLGTTFAGTGVEVRCDPANPKQLRLLMVAHSKLGGWLPQGMINKHLGAAFSDIMSNYAPGNRSHIGIRP